MKPSLMRAVRASAVALVVAVSLAAPGVGLQAPVARAEASWNDEFADICSKTQDAMALGDEELRSLIQRCDKLMLVIDKLDGPERKVYSRRLKGCRDLYQFVLDARASRSPG